MKKKNQILLFLLTIAFFGCDSKSETLQNATQPNQFQNLLEGEFIDDWTYRVTPNLYSNFNVAEFRLWVPNPENTSNLKAVLVLLSSWNSNALGLANSSEWQDYATINDLAILSVHLKSENFTNPYFYASGASGRALLYALNTITEHQSIQNVSTLPFLMRGYSGGGLFCYYFADYEPNKVIAIANIKGGLGDPFHAEQTTDANLIVPTLFIAGELDLPATNNWLKNTVREKRNKGGLWSYTTELGADHFGGLDDSDELIKHFFTATLNARISNISDTLATIQENSGWLGNNTSKNIFSFENYPDSQNENSSWLINEDFAIKWQAFQAD